MSDTQYTSADTSAAAEVIDQLAAAQQREATAAAVASMKSPLDRALSKPSPRPAAPLQTLYEPNALTTPSPTLHPGVIAALDGYDDSTKGYVGGAETAMSEMYEAITSVVTKKQAARSNPTWNESMAVIMVGNEAAKLQEAVTRKVDAALGALTKGINSLSAELRAPVQANVNSPLSAEVAAFVRGLDDGKRLTFLTTALADGDTTAMHAVLGRPPYLSGITKEMQASLTERWNRRMQPDTARKLALMEGAKDRLEKAGSLFITQFEAALGIKGGWATVQRLRAQQSSALKAFKGA